MKPINEQIVVITGASSGIGRATALEFAKRGATVVLAARNDEALQEVAGQIAQEGGQAHVVVTDVAEWDQVNRLALDTVGRFERIDTWVNDASVSEYATVEQMTVAEIERIIQVNLLGTVYGVKAVLPHMKRQGEGTIINVSSVLGVRSVPLQAAYCAAKHGVKGFTESLRMELVHEHRGIIVTLIKPSSINTPFFNHARSKLGTKPMPVPPAYAPQEVAAAIVFAAEHPVRDVTVGGAGKMLDLLERVSPSFVDWLLLRGGLGFKSQKSAQPDEGRDNLFAPVREPGSVTGDYGKLTMPVSLYTRLVDLYPARKRLLAAAGLLGGVVLLRRLGRQG
jgi:short-subunit dehydrogenase